MTALPRTVKRASVKAAKRKAKWRADWVLAIREILGIKLWKGQRRLVRAIQEHRRVVCTSGHKVGKTLLSACLAIILLYLYPNARIITTAGTGDQVKENIWGEIRERAAGARVTLPDGLMPSAPEWRVGPLHYAKGLSTNTPDSFQGKHSEDGIVVVIMDEAQPIPLAIVNASKSMTSDANGYFFAIANPTDPTSWLREAAETDPTWHHVTLSCYDHPNIVQSLKLGRDVKVMAGPTMDLIRTFEGTPDEGPRLRGTYNHEQGKSLIPKAALDRCHAVPADQLPDDAGHLGVDIADGGGDKCVAVYQKGRRVLDVREWAYVGDRTGLMQTTGKIQALAAEFGVEPENVHVDGIGVGAAVVSRLHELGFDCDDVQFGGGVVGDWDELIGDEIQLGNRRAELYWAARCAIIEQSIEIPEKYRMIHADLAAPGWGYMSTGKIKVEKKDDIKDRLGRSPDHGDAFVLSMSRAGSMGPSFLGVFGSNDRGHFG